MKEALRRISAVYYAMYSATIVLSVVAYLLNFNSIVVQVPQQNIMIAMEIIYYVLVFVLLTLSFWKFYTNIKKCRQIDDLHEKMELYIKSAIFRLYASGILLISGVILFFVLRNLDLLYGIAITALALIFSKPTENKILNDLNLDVED